MLPKGNRTQEKKDVRTSISGSVFKMSGIEKSLSKYNTFVRCVFNLNPISSLHSNEQNFKFKHQKPKDRQILHSFTLVTLLVRNRV